MPKPPETDTAIDRGLVYLAKEQLKDGSFVSFSSASAQPFRRLRSWQTNFVPALILAALVDLEQPPALAIRNNLAKFLMDQKSPNWSFNYWSKSAPEYTAQPYPDDLDDTFCALAALYLHNPSLINGKVLADLTKLLLATETAVGGPYRTWLVPADSQPVWLDVDIAVNSNIAYFLSLTGSHLPHLNEMLGKAISSDSFVSPYYPFEYAFIYYFARSYSGPQQARLLRKARRMHKAARTDLDRALCLTARLRLGETQNLSSKIKELLEGQKSDGSWPPAAFYADPVKQGRPYYNGGAALTTAFALEALRLSSRKSASLKNRVSGLKTKTDTSLKTSILKMAKEQCSGLNQELRKATLTSLQRVADSDNGPEIIGLAAMFEQSLTKPVHNTEPNFTEKLGLANLYGWLAYTIYDDFVDNEGKPELISVANVAMRRSLDNFLESLPANRQFSAAVHETFDTIDGANAWELAHCRFKVRNNVIKVQKLPDYGDNSKLAERSLGHVLPVLAVLAASGIQPEMPAARQVIRAFKNYLIARQLNDDAHDWPEDLQNGHITPVVARILNDLAVGRGEHQLASLLPRARRQLWRSTLLKVCDSMRHHIQLSRQALSESNLCQPDNVLSDLLDGIEVSINDTLSQQQQAEDFLEQYKQPSGKTAKL